MGTIGPSLQDTAYLVRDAKSLIRKVIRHTDHKYGLTNLSCSAYDTKPSPNGEKSWLFPEIFSV